MQYLILALMCLGITQTAAADKGGIALLQDFLKQSPTVKLSFRQKGLDSKGDVTSNSEGRLWFRRPHFFRMEYDSPERLEIVSDGENTWTYEPDIQQVLVQSVDKLAGASVLLDMLASGDIEALRDKYVLLSSPSNQGRWVVAEARHADQAIVKMRVEFSEDGGLQRAELTDSFGSVAQLDFQVLSRQPIDELIFKFNLPTGVDIVRE